ncbi:50S ribosomal protein L3 N(5)-glutamine methyltransferase [Legionella sp. km772]|uniref:50S ribosomal protein L3 N(5)-glutamine methyltransferase n=1 Tax=Legionella sp. km772 TaxID=2498111 RepID=UPI000F8DAFFE|nr:50S ribosomal protein L3 N(5)-glutamine methyltransferase [Legionella sp. km772]RUR09282.1 50S ribosomal protein L3 N(5)-glutamine methyltransferase [Legionella sp. km772]
MTNCIIKETDELVTILDFLRFSLSCATEAQLYYGHGTDNVWDDMRSLILRSLSLPYDVDPALLNARLTTNEKKYLCQQLEKRINQRVPVPYLIKEAYFCDLPFYVDERVLIPRSPIAELIREQFSPWIEEGQVGRVLDLCTGSGCIAIACCYAFPEALVDAVDISSEALAVAAINKERLAVDEQLTLIESDCFDEVPAQHYDIIVSNPPYVGKEEMQTLPDEYRHEPVLALETSNNGLSIVEKILNTAHAYLSEQGILVVEVGNSEEALCEAYPSVPFTWLEMSHGGQGIFLLTKQQLEEYFN